MNEKKDFIYSAKLPSAEGKGGRKFGKGGSPPTKLNPLQDAKAKEMMSRVVNRIKLSSEGWMELRKDLESHEPKEYIARKFGIKHNDLKWLKKYLGYS